MGTGVGILVGDVGRAVPGDDPEGALGERGGVVVELDGEGEAVPGRCGCIVTVVCFGNGMAMKRGSVRVLAREEAGPGAEEGWGEARKGGDVVRENLGGGDPVVEGEAERDVLFVREVAHEESACEGDGGKLCGCGRGG
jgi:hypothetical protein